jgi:hypothetical protein
LSFKQNSKEKIEKDTYMRYNNGWKVKQLLLLKTFSFHFVYTKLSVTEQRRTHRDLLQFCKMGPYCGYQNHVHQLKRDEFINRM